MTSLAPESKDAHGHCSRNREEIERSEMCGCFYCERVFSPSEISNWIDEGYTAMCPHCDIDAVIGSASGLPIEKQFLERMNKVWF